MELTSKQELAIVAIVESPTLTRASEVSNVSRQTLYTWMSDPTFRLALLRSRQHAMTVASTILTANLVNASDTIVDVMDNPESRPVREQKLRLQAARMIQQGAHRFQNDELLAAEAEALC